jgi:hypothetical protein
MFGSGPALTHDARRFLCRLDAEPDIELLGAFCQARTTSIRGVFADLWKRRGTLAIPLFLLWIGRGISSFASSPRAEMSMRRHLRRISDRIHFVVDIHAEEVLDAVRGLRPDLGLVYGSPILKPGLFEIPSFGTLGIHHGKVPEYRGNKTTFWAIYNGERRAGVTIQKINAGLDTGQIVREGSVPIGRRGRTAVWRDLENLGLDLYIRSILDVRNGTAEYRSQGGPKGKLYRNPKLGDLVRFHLIRMKRRWRWAPTEDSTPSSRPGSTQGRADRPSGNRREGR